MTDSRSLSFYIALSDPPGATLTVNRSDRSRSFSALGMLWNSDSDLDRKSFRLNLIEGDFAREMKKRDESRSRLKRANSESFAPMIVAADAIGAIGVTPAAEPTEWEPPLQAAVYICPADYDASLEIIKAASLNNRLIGVTLIVRPEQNAKFKRDGAIYTVKDIDLSEGFKGDVTAITIHQAIYQRVSDDERAVELPPDIHKQKPTTNLDVKINEISISYSMPSGYMDTFTLGGNVVLCGAKDIVGAECDVSLQEYEREEHHKYPQKALSGTFFWQKMARSLSVDLRYRRADLDDQLKMFRTSSPGDLIRLRLTLLVDAAVFQLDEQRGDIGSWGISCFRKFS